MTTKSTCFQDYVKCITRRPTADPAKDLDCGVELVRCVYSTIRGAMVTTGAGRGAIDNAVIRGQLSDHDVSTIQSFASEVRAITHSNPEHGSKREQDLSSRVEQYMTALVGRLP